MDYEHLHFGRYYGTLYRKTVQFTREATRPLGLTWTELIVLIVAVDEPGTMQDSIAKHLSLDKAVAARALKRLEQLDLIERCDDPDNQRIKKVYPTKAATPIKARYDQIINHWNKIILNGYSTKERQEIILAFKKMRDCATEVDIKEEVKKLYESDTH